MSLYDWPGQSARERVNKLPQSNIYSASAEDIGALFRDYLEGDTPCAVLAVSERPLDEAARNAIARSLESFGYGAGACSYATLLPADDTVEGGDIPLDAQALFLLVEGLDPICLICADGVSAACLGEAYRTKCEPDSSNRLMGRTVVAFRNLSALLTTESGKQRAWHLLKTLPKR